MEKIIGRLENWKFRTAYEWALEYEGFPYEALSAIGVLADMYDDCGWQYGLAFEPVDRLLTFIAKLLNYRITESGDWEISGQTVTLTNVGSNVVTIDGIRLYAGPGVGVYVNEKGELVAYDPAKGVPDDAQKGGEYKVTPSKWVTASEHSLRTPDDEKIMREMSDKWLLLHEPLPTTYLLVRTFAGHDLAVFIKRDIRSKKFRIVRGENSIPESYMFKDSGMFGYTENREDVHKNEFDTLEEAVACFNKHWSQILK